MKEYEKEFYNIKWSDYKNVPKETRRFFWISTVIFMFTMIGIGTASFVLKNSILMLISYIALIPTTSIYLFLINRKTEFTIDELILKNEERLVELWTLLGNQKYDLNSDLGIEYCLKETERVIGEPKYLEEHISPIFKMIYRWLAPIFGFIIGIQQQVIDKHELLLISFVVLMASLVILGVIIMIYSIIESKLNKRYYIAKSLHSKLKDISFLYTDGKLT